MKMLQTMSLMGSVALIFYYSMKLVGRRALPYSFYRKMLILCMAFFLFPFPHFIYRYMDLLEKIFPLEEWGIKENLLRFQLNKPYENYILYTKDMEFQINHPLFYIISLICVGVMLIFLIWYLHQSKSFRESVCDYSGQAVNDCGEEKKFEELRADMGMKQNIRLRTSSRVDSPVMVGVIKPIILVPIKEISDLELIHEINHVKRQDMLFTILSKVILVLNFYNPFAWLLHYEWGRVVELACDEAVLDYAGEERTTEYGNLLIDAAQQECRTEKQYALGVDSKKVKGLTKERIKNMKNRRKMNGWKRFAAAVCVGCMTFATSLTAFAYEPDVLWETEELGDSEMELVFYTEEGFEKEQNMHTVDINGEMITYESKGYEQELVYLDENGEIVVTEYKEPEAETRAVCSHTYTSGIASTHVKNSNGGCTTTYYKVTICSKCGYVKSKTYYKTETSDVCTH